MSRRFQLIAHNIFRFLCYFSKKLQHFFYPKFFLSTAVDSLILILPYFKINMVLYAASDQYIKLGISLRKAYSLNLQLYGESGTHYHSWVETYWLLLASSYRLGRKCVTQTDNTHQDYSVTNKIQISFYSSPSENKFFFLLGDLQHKY